MKFRTFASAVAPLALLVATPALAQAPAAAAAKPDLDPAVWVVKDADTTIYLFGTIHVLDGKSDWFNDEVRASFDKSGELVLETILPEKQEDMAPLVMKYGLDLTGKPLSQKLSPEGAKRLAAAAKTAGLPIEALDRFKPFFAAMTLSALQYQKLGMTPETGAEKTLTAAAKANGKAVGQLETLDYQLSLFDALPEAEQIRLLEESLKDDGTASKEIGELVKHWGAGDPEGLAKIINKTETESAQLMKVLLTDRNANWANWIQQRMAKPGTVFIAVGAGHLAGKASVQELLKAKGIASARVPHAQ